VKTEKGLQARLGRKRCRGKGGWRVIGMASWKEKVILELVYYFFFFGLWDPSSSTSDRTQATTVQMFQVLITGPPKAGFFKAQLIFQL